MNWAYHPNSPLLPIYLTTDYEKKLQVFQTFQKIYSMLEAVSMSFEMCPTHILTLIDFTLMKPNGYY